MDDQSHQITALAELLRQFAISGWVVTIDAMGGQREMAEHMLLQEADSVVALKAHQPDRLEEGIDGFTQAESATSQEVSPQAAETITNGHGRLEIRRHRVLTEPESLTWLQAEQHWPGLRALGRVEAERRSGEERTKEARSYLLSQAMSAATFAEAVRSHWGSENAVHWVLDGSCGEDQSRMPAGHAAEKHGRFAPSRAPSARTRAKPAWPASQGQTPQSGVG